MILEILGVVFLVVIALVGYFAWKIYHHSKAKADSNFVKAIAALPQMHMELSPSTSEIWRERDRLDFAESELKKVGATHVGYFEALTGQATIHLSIWNFKDQAVPVIYEAFSEQTSQSVMFYHEVACKTGSGSLCVTSNHHALLDSRPDTHRLTFLESNSVLKQLKSLKPSLKEGERIQKINDPKAFLMETLEDITEWGWRLEQLQSDKTLQVLASVGVKMNEGLMEELVEMGSAYRVEVYVARARSKLAQHSKMKAAQWERIRDKLVFVNEIMQVDHLVEAVYDLAGELTEEQEKVVDAFHTNNEALTDPIGAFQMLLSSLDLKAKRLTSLKSPVKTEVFLPL